MNRHLKILLLGSYVWYFGEGLLGPLYAVFAQKIGGDILDLTAAYSMFLIVTGVLSIFVGKLADKRPKGSLMSHLMIAGYGLNALATFGYIFVDNPTKLFVVQFVLGISTALATPTWEALFTLNTDKKKLGEQWGFSDGGPKIITGISIILGGLLITFSSFTVLFLLMGIIQLIATVIQYLIYLKPRS